MRLLDPEDAHNLALRALALGLGPRAAPAGDALRVDLAGLSLPNPVGLAAGFDKNAEAPDAMLRAGFGFVECGTVTPRPQAGNPRPRLFRLVQDGAVINRMGFNNAGLEAFARRLETRLARGHTGIVGANLGANKDSEDRSGDYVTGLDRLWGLASYFTINISSPNTPGLRGLQDRGALEVLLDRVCACRAMKSGRAPLFLKVAPDLDEAQIAEISAVTLQSGLDGLIVSNTTTARPASLVSAHRTETGGLSGKPLLAPSTRALKSFSDHLEGRLALIGVGGIACAHDVRAKFAAGAHAVQLYSALALQGPGLIGRILHELAEPQQDRKSVNGESESMQAARQSSAKDASP